MPLRQFLYYDDSLVSDFLAQLQGGQTDEVFRREQLPSIEGIPGQQTEETQAIIRQVRASKFERLHQLLVDSGELIDIEGNLDATGWNGLTRGVVFELEARLAIPQIARVLSDPDGLAGLVSLIRNVSPESLDAEVEPFLGMLEALTSARGSSLGNMTVIGSTLGSIYRLIIRLNRQHIIDDSDLDGDAIVVCKLIRKLKETDRELVIDLPGLSVLDADARQAMTEGPESAAMTVQGPGAIVVPIAIFR